MRLSNFLALPRYCYTAEWLFCGVVAFISCAVTSRPARFYKRLVGGCLSGGIEHVACLVYLPHSIAHTTKGWACEDLRLPRRVHRMSSGVAAVSVENNRPLSAPGATVVYTFSISMKSVPLKSPKAQFALYHNQWRSHSGEVGERDG